MEEWKYIENSDKCYISNMGNVRQKTNNGFVILSPRLSNGYFRITIPKYGTEWIHRLVALYFCEGKDDIKNVVNHKDGKKTNNFYKNLEWVTAWENSKKAGENGQLSYDRTLSYKGKILAIKANKNNEIEELMLLPNQKKFSEYTGIHTGSISRAISSKPKERKTTNNWRLYKL